MTSTQGLVTEPVANPRRVQLLDEPVPDEEREAAEGDGEPADSDRP